MKSSIRPLLLIASAFLAATLSLTPAAASAMAASSPKAVSAPARISSSQWMTYNPQTKTAHLTLISAYGQDTYNFNGASNGHLVVTVPLGSKVVVKYSNQSMHMPHGAEIVSWTGSLPTGAPPVPAFSGAASPNYLHGTPTGVVQTFTFTANRPGKYLIICPVRNHVKFGHWAWLIVSRTATAPRVVIKP